MPRAPVDEPAMVAAVAAAYPLGRWRFWRRTDVGASNTSWFVETDGGSVVLRRSHALKTVAGARFESSLVDALRAHGFPAPAVQRTRSGDVLVVVDGLVHMVTRRLPGADYDRRSSTHLAAAARGLARYHGIVSELLVSGLVVSQLATPPRGERSSELARLGPAGRETLRTAAEAVTSHMGASRREAVRDLARHLADQMELLHTELGEWPDGSTSVVVHGSYAPSALLLTGDQLTGVLDFDRATPDLLGLDLAYALDAFCRPGEVRRTGVGLDLDLARRFLAHYRAEAPVADADLRSLPALLRAQRLGKVLKKCDNVFAMQAVAARQQEEVPRFARVLETECARVRWLSDNVPTLTEEA